MNRFTISQLSRFSGVKPHTIRIWEQRYNALEPGRSEGNTRFYSDDQLKRLLNIVSLIDADFRVAEACSMKNRELDAEVKKLVDLKSSASSSTSFVSELLYAGLRYDEKEFDRHFNLAKKKLGFKRCYVEVIYPLIERLGLLWAESTIIPSQEHFISNLVRQKIIAATEELTITSGTEPWILFLPEDEFHELGILVANYLIRSSGRKTIYLGANLPLSTLEQAVRDVKPTAALFFSVRNEEPDLLQSYVNRLTRLQHLNQIFIAKTLRENDVEIKGRKIHLLRTVTDLEKALTQGL